MKLRTWNSSACGVLVAAGLIAALAMAGTVQGREPASLASNRQELRAELDRLPQAQLQGLILRCDREAATRILDVSDAVPCAMALDALLERQFRGDFQAFLAWWREQKSR